MDFKPLSGGCLCGAIRYTLKEPAKSIEHCHCSNCRRAHGAFYASGGLYSASAVEIVTGQNNLQHYESSAGNYRKFCKTCGCHLFMTVDHFPNEVYVWVASIDDGAHPGHPAEKEAHIFTSSKAPWEHVSTKLPHFDEINSAISIGQENG